MRKAPYPVAVALVAALGLSTTSGIVDAQTPELTLVKTVGADPDMCAAPPPPSPWSTSPSSSHADTSDATTTEPNASYTSPSG